MVELMGVGVPLYFQSMGFEVGVGIVYLVPPSCVWGLENPVFSPLITVEGVPPTEPCH